MQKWIIIIVIFIILIITTIIVLNVDIETEYTPETEIEERDLRKTIISLFFKSNDGNELVKESRLIDSKNLLISPYDEVIKMLISGPENSNYKRCISENTVVLDTKLEGDCLVINFNNEFLNNISDENEKKLAIESILNSLSQFTEINTIKILVEGNEI